MNVETIAKHLLICLVWVDKPEGTSPRLSKQAEKAALEFAREFAKKIEPRWQEVLDCPAYGSHPDAGSPEALVGHDLWLTSQGAGAGFWDRSELPDELGRWLTKMVDEMPSVYVEFYRGWTYLHIAARRAA